MTAQGAIAGTHQDRAETTQQGVIPAIYQDTTSPISLGAMCQDRNQDATPMNQDTTAQHYDTITRTYQDTILGAPTQLKIVAPSHYDTIALTRTHQDTTHRQDQDIKEAMNCDQDTVGCDQDTVGCDQDTTSHAAHLNSITPSHYDDIVIAKPSSHQDSKTFVHQDTTMHQDNATPIHQDASIQGNAAPVHHDQDTTMRAHQDGIDLDSVNEDVKHQDTTATYQDTMTTHQDIMATHRDTTAIHQDTMATHQDTTVPDQHLNCTEPIKPKGSVLSHLPLTLELGDVDLAESAYAIPSELDTKF